MRRSAIACVLAFVLANGAAAQPDAETAGPSSIVATVRSLQQVQDDVVAGDHSAVAMQRYLTGLIDERLRSADSDEFRNRQMVEAAFIYAMSGGNPATLSLLAARDEAGRFDPELVAALQAYSDGRGAAVADALAAMTESYAGSPLEPYLALIAGNAAAVTKPEDALALYDLAQLLLPGTIVEEAALRRSIEIARDEGNIEGGLERAERYTRRFLHSPYAAQFADLFVDLVLAHPDHVAEKRIRETIGSMDVARQRSIYLRIARQAAVGGNRRLAVEAAGAAQRLGSESDKVETLAGLYARLTDPTGEIGSIDPALLSVRDEALHRAAKAVKAAVLSPPEPAKTEMVAVSTPETSGEAEPLAAFLEGGWDTVNAIDDLLGDGR